MTREERLKISEEFNALTFEQRGVAIKVELCARILDVEIAKKRLKTNYTREMKYLNDKIKSFEQNLKRDL